MKKIHVIFLVLSILGHSMAHATTANPFNGFYSGGSLGNSFAQTNLQFSGSADAVLTGFATTVVPIGSQTHLVKNALIGSLFSGYGHTWDRRYLGGELLVSASNYRMDGTTNTGLSQDFNLFSSVTFLVGADAAIKTQAKISPIQFVAALRPGYLLTPDTLLYGRVGAAIARVSFNANTSASSSVGLVTPGSTTNLLFPITLQASANKLLAGLQVGGGLEQKCNDRWSVRVDYTYTDYGRLQANATKSTNLIDFSGATAGALSVIGRNSVRIIDQTIMLGVLYHFPT